MSLLADPISNRKGEVQEVMSIRVMPAETAKPMAESGKPRRPVARVRILLTTNTITTTILALVSGQLPH
ncbi:hypothetical protein KC331_g4 [Hortaea werneckii]|nr:hypothetical protein KC331_g4 [Hortaea werneckii]